LKLTTKELADLMKVAETETGEPVTDLGDGCVELNMDSLLELPNQLMALGRYLLETLQRKDDSEDYSSAIEQFDLQQKQLRHDTDYTKKQLAGYRISVCETPINTNESDETIKAAIKKSVSGPLQTITINADGQKYNVLIGYNLLTREAKAFAIVREDGQTVLYTLIVQEK
jgi:predicted  nucleic acid-binding Zn-ribbon protein